MCLIVFAWKAHPDYKLVLGANRDEFHGRPAKALAWWPDIPGVLAGRDLQAGGTWLAMHRSGRFATVTNYREYTVTDDRKQSRGSLVTDFVSGGMEPMAFSNAIDGEQFAGFSMLAATNDELVYFSNRNDKESPLAPGIYGLSNATLDTPWPKVIRTRDALNALLDAGQVNESTLMHLLADRTLAPVADVDSEQLPFELARALTAPFIISPDYGTRCSTVLLWSSAGEVTVCERRFDAGGDAGGDSRFSFTIEQP